jgi:hypothetical protein
MEVEMTPGDTDMDWLETACEDLVASNPGQISAWGYRTIAKLMLGLRNVSHERIPGLLIFGTGRDSGFWQDVAEAARGRVVFLESEQGWIERTRSSWPLITVIKVDYGPEKRADWLKLLDKPQSFFELDVPEVVGNGQEWDVILVDSPAGYSDSTPGRMKSIATAVKLAESNPYGASVFVHDIDRTVEKVYSQLFLAPKSCLVRMGEERDRLAEFVFSPRKLGDGVR